MPVATIPEVEHHVSSVNGVNLHYVTAGHGEPVVLLHGWPETWYSWRNVIPALAKQFHVIAPDMRGLGDSQKPDSGYDKKTVAEDIHQLVRSLGHENVALIGHDMGATVLYPYACMYAAEVKKLIFVDVAPLGAAEDPVAIHPWHFGFHAIPDLPEKLTQGREREYLLSFYGAAYPVYITEDAVAEYVRCYSSLGGMRAGFDYYRAFPKDIADNKLFAKKPLNMPILCIGGAKLFGEHAYRVIKQLGTNVKSEVIEDSGHWMIEDRPETFNRLILNFLT